MSRHKKGTAKNIHAYPQIRKYHGIKAAVNMSLYLDEGQYVVYYYNVKDDFVWGELNKWDSHYTQKHIVRLGDFTEHIKMDDLKKMIDSRCWYWYRHNKIPAIYKCS